MALVRCDFFSEVLEVGTSMTVLLPQASEEQIGISTSSTARDEGSTTRDEDSTTRDEGSNDRDEGSNDRGDFPVLYLLHGLSDDSTAWLRYTSIERYAAPLGLAVVMPQVQRSFYADEVHGERFFTFLCDELPEVVQRFFRVSREREDTFVAGLSMGGYGALKWALHRPGQFAAAASLSGALDLDAINQDEWRKPLMQRVFDGRVGPRDDLFALLADADVESLPSLYVGCGTEDHLYEHNVRFVDAATAAGVDVQVDFRAGEHEWGVWDAAIRDVLAWLPVRR